MKYRKLRIAWSVAWGVACLLLIVLWVRSYWINDPDVIARFQRRHTWNLGLYSRNAVFIVKFEDRTKPLDGVARPVRSSVGIRVISSPMLTAVVIPHGYILLFAIGIAAAPWLAWRFSLRTMLIAMTVAAVLLGAVVYLMRS